jgi:hypothetical protein
MQKRAIVKRLGPKQIKQELAVYEKKYGMTSREFYENYRGGKLDGSRDFVRWAGLCRMLVAATAAPRAAST